MFSIGSSTQQTEGGFSLIGLALLGAAAVAVLAMVRRYRAAVRADGDHPASGGGCLAQPASLSVSCSWSGCYRRRKVTRERRLRLGLALISRPLIGFTMEFYREVWIDKAF